MINQLKSGRILSIDAFRGITILVMIFVNSVSGVSGIPAWMQHAHGNEDRMTFVDVVFPAFLFIVGMSVPFAINSRLAKGDSFWKLQQHIAWRTLGLLVLGVFMVNAEGVNAAATGMNGALWALLFYACVMLVWNVYTFKQSWISWCLKGIGMAGLIILGIIYRGGDGSERLSPQWWGILGLIGWAYLYACIIYQLFRGNAGGIMLMIAVCIGFYALCERPFMQDSSWSWLTTQQGNAAHTAIVLCGMVLTLFYFDDELGLTGSKLFARVSGFLIIMLIAAWRLRPAYKISKIHATPSWCLYSAAICVAVFSFLYFLIDVKRVSKWTAFFRPAGSNPLLTYILPDIVFYGMLLAGIGLPAVLGEGWPGMAWCAFFAVAMLFVVKGLNKLGIRLQL
jgi:heparan-alpha-glucosaminide N-acetyltransferase